MTDFQKAQLIVSAAKQGSSLKKHQMYILQAAVRGELGPATRLIFDALWEDYKVSSGGTVNPGHSSAVKEGQG